MLNDPFELSLDIPIDPDQGPLEKLSCSLRIYGTQAQAQQRIDVEGPIKVTHYMLEIP